MKFDQFPQFPSERLAGSGSLDAESLYRLEAELGSLADERVAKEKFPQVYPEESQAVRGILKEIKSLWEKGQKAKEYLGLLLGVANSYREKGAEGVQTFIYNNLARLISGITSRKIEDFDKYTACEHGDSALALLTKYGGTLELVEQAMPNLERKVFYPKGETGESAQKEACDKGVIFFICGYGASLEPYKGIFEQFNLPVVAYQLPHGVINENPDVVGKTFDDVYKEMQADPLLEKVTHVIGNSIGTMLASRLAVDVGKEREGKSLQVALVQVGRSWQGALERTHAKFADQLRARLKKQGWTLADFQKATEKYNPIELADDFTELIDKGRLDLSLFVGSGDKMIFPVSEEIDPLLKKLDSGKASGKYNAYISEVAGHNSAVLFFLWLAFQKSTEWSRVFKCFNPETDSVKTPKKLERHHVRRTNWGRANDKQKSPGI